ncbi:Cytotoxic translational repressor of toxin-antitoxin stability system [Candidatus Magnetomoraceae bacterium gMMP-1]
MKWKVKLTKKADKGKLKLMRSGRKRELEVFAVLIEMLKNSGPVQPTFQNFSKLGNNEYHCHLSHKWVACWKKVKNQIILEIYYVGPRENAPY